MAENVYKFFCNFHGTSDHENLSLKIISSYSNFQI